MCITTEVRAHYINKCNKYTGGLCRSDAYSQRENRCGSDFMKSKQNMTGVACIFIVHQRQS